MLTPRSSSARVGPRPEPSAKTKSPPARVSRRRVSSVAAKAPSPGESNPGCAEAATRCHDVPRALPFAPGGRGRMKWIRRALAVIVALPVLAVLALFILGQRESAGQNSASIMIDRPRSEVFKHIADLDRLRRWTGITEIHRLTPPPVQKGTRFRAVTVRRDQRAEVAGEITGFDPDDSIGFVNRSAGGAPTPFVQEAVYRLEGSGGQCRLTLTVRTRYEGWLVRLLEPVITPAAQKEMTRLLRALKAQVESESSLTAAEEKPKGAADRGADRP